MKLYMAQKKSHEVDQFINTVNGAFPLVLLYGPDKGLVSERAQRYADKTGLSLDDPFSVIRLEAEELEADPLKLADEAYTVSMFGGKRLIWVRNVGSQKKLADAIKQLIVSPPDETLILIEAGDLKKGAAIRTAFESGSVAMALPCYADDARNIDSVIDNILDKHKLQISMDARHLLRNSLGGDRLATRAEIEKLALYAHGKTRIEAEDIRQSVGDVSAISVDEIVDAVVTGNIKSFETAFSRIVSSGTQPFLAVNATLRQFQQIQTLRYIVDTEKKPVSMVIASARPPIFFTRRKMVEQAVSVWKADGLMRVMERLHRAVLESRQNSALATAIIRQSLMAICIESARNTRRK